MAQGHYWTRDSDEAQRGWREIFGLIGGAIPKEVYEKMPLYSYAPGGSSFGKEATVEEYMQALRAWVARNPREKWQSKEELKF